MHESMKKMVFIFIFSTFLIGNPNFSERKSSLLKKSEKQVSTANDSALKIAFEALVEKVKTNLKLPRKFIFR